MKIGEVMKSVKTIDVDLSLAKASEIMNSEYCKKFWKKC